MGIWMQGPRSAAGLGALVVASFLFLSGPPALGQKGKGKGKEPATPALAPAGGATLWPAGGPVSSLAVSADGKLLVAAVSRKKVMTLAGHTSRVSQVRFSPDGKRILSVGWDRTVRLWDAETGKQVWVFEGHTETVLCGAFSPDGKFVATGGWDTTVRVVPVR